MANFLSILEQQWRGVLVLAFLLLVLLFLIREVFRLMNWGRFKKANGVGTTSAATSAQEGLSFFASQFIAKTISEFRHLLALLIFLLFAAAVILSVLPGFYELDVNKMTEGLEGVAAALGGLVGSIIGYYFGEQVGSANIRSGERADSKGELKNVEEIRPARIPTTAKVEDKPEPKP